MPARFRFSHPAALEPPQIVTAEGGVKLQGDWTLISLHPRLRSLRARLHALQGYAQTWDLSSVSRIDAFGAQLLWRSWGLREPAVLVLPPHARGAFERIRAAAAIPRQRPRRDWLRPLVALGWMAMSFWAHARGLIELLGHVIIECVRLLRHPREFPWLDVSAALFKIGAQAMPIAAMLGFLIGVVFAYLTALQLQNFGADVYIVNILGLGVIRELGPMLVSVLVAGRSGSAITAQIGVMRVTEEIDALAAMGVSRYQRLILPKVIALAIAMPLLVLWSSASALIGGMFASELQLNLDYRFFLDMLPKVVPVANVWIGLGKGVAFGVAIAVVACHFGLRIKPNTESLSTNTTASVVTAISAVIVLDAIIAILTRTVGVIVR